MKYSVVLKVQSVVTTLTAVQEVTTRALDIADDVTIYSYGVNQNCLVDIEEALGVVLYLTVGYREILYLAISCEIEALSTVGTCTIKSYLIYSEWSLYLEATLDNRMVILTQSLDGESLADSYRTTGSSLVSSDTIFTWLNNQAIALRSILYDSCDISTSLN